jgi:CheY-like chemotaxis protein
MVTVINTFEEIWNIQNIALPTVLIIDAKFEHSTGLDLCYLLRNNLYFNHIPIAMIGNSHPYVLDAIIQAGIDYFIDRNKLTSQLLSFSDWLNRKSYQCRS